MGQSTPLAVVGIGRMGAVHARNVLALSQETRVCTLAALVDTDVERARRFAEQNRCAAPVFASLEDLIEADVCSAAVVVTPTDTHRATASRLLQAGFRVLLEKPLTGTLSEDEEFAAELDRSHPHGVMLAFQRRFDAALQYTKELMQSGAIGRVFKIYTSLEDSNPAPDGYQSGGILPDMSVHNVDEILWLTGRTPTAALAVGSRIYSHALTTCQEDFDDALLCLWFGDDLLAQVQVSRNHVSGYRVETILFGEQGQIQVGRFSQNPSEITVRAYGRRGRNEPIASRSFPGGEDPLDQPEFVARFGSAYKAEVAVFAEHCRTGAAFPTSHRDALRAQQAITSGMQRLYTAR